MQITRDGLDTAMGSDTWFTGDVYVDAVAAAPAPARVQAKRPGDRVFFEPDEGHWHGAAPNGFMVHLALNEVDDDDVAVNWGEQVTEKEYAATPGREH